MTFRAGGIAAFRSALEMTVRDPEALRFWYHDVISVMASTLLVNTVLIEGLWWREIDTPEDLAEVRASFSRREFTAGVRHPPRIHTVPLKV
jgi:choline kinase